MKKITIILLFCITAATSFGKKPFEGTITFGVDISGDGIEQMAAALMPTSYNYNFQNGDVLFSINGGMLAGMLGEILMKGKEQTAYMIKHDDKVIYEIAGKNDDAAIKPEIVPDSEIIEILGYACKKYRIEIDNNGTPVTQYVWTTQELNMELPDENKRIPGTGSNIFIPGLEGFPLKVVSSMMGMTVTMTAQKVEKKSLPAYMFQVPTDYKKETFDPSILMGF